MKKIKSISYDEVVTFFEKEHPVDETSPNFAGNKWAMKHLEWANDVSKGEWTLCELEPEDILGIVFSHHTSEETEHSLINVQGMTLNQTLTLMKENNVEYAKNNPVCWSKIMYWQNKDFSPVLLSTRPTPGKGKRSDVDINLGNLFHQDGLHRLIRWGLDGRFELNKYSQGPKLTAFVSGRI